MARGLHIVLEGIDGSGKTTVVKRLRDALPESFSTAEPTQKGAGVLARKLLGSLPPGFDPRELALLFIADRHAHVVRIQRALVQGVSVVQDRGLLSTYCYQADVLSRQTLDELHRGLPEPDLTILLDLSVDLAVARLASRGGNPEVYEKAATLEVMRRRYLAEAVARTPGVEVVDAGQPLEQVVAECLRLVERQRAKRSAGGQP